MIQIQVMERVSKHLSLVAAAVMISGSACNGGSMGADPGDTPYTPYDPPAADTGTTAPPDPDPVADDGGVVTYDDAGTPIDPGVEEELEAYVARRKVEILAGNEFS